MSILAKFFSGSLTFFIVAGFSACNSTSESPRPPSKEDSLKHIELIKDIELATKRNKELTEENNAMEARMQAEQKAIDSFEKSPAGKAKMIDRINAQKQQEVKERENSKKYQKLMNKFGCSEDEAKAILKGKIWIGMTYEMLLYMWGKEDNLNISNYGNGNKYQACWHDYTPSCFYFKGDHVVYAYN